MRAQEKSLSVVIPGRTIEMVEKLAMELQKRRYDMYYRDYEAQRDAYTAELLQIQHNVRLLEMLKPTLDTDDLHANSSFGALVGEYQTIRTNALITWQPPTIKKVMDVITLARLTFRRQLILKESGLFSNDKAKRGQELREVTALNNEIKKMEADLNE